MNGKQGSLMNIVGGMYTFIEILLDILINLYLIAVACIMPFYYTQGYGRIGTDKYEFFFNITLKSGMVFLPVLGLFWVVWLFKIILERAGHPELHLAEKMTAGTVWNVIRHNVTLTDCFVALYGVALVCSYLLSAYRENGFYGNAFYGADGWYLGFATQMLFLAIYFVVSRFWIPQKWPLCVGLLASAGVFALGYLNRFQIYPIEMQYRNESFVSTVGNINWYCGYVVTVLFGAVYFWWMQKKGNFFLKFLLAVYIVLGFGTLITQGSRSGLLALFVAMVVLGLLSVSDGKRMANFWAIGILLGCACVITMILRYVLKDKYDGFEILVDWLTYSPLAVVIIAVALLFYILVWWWNKKNIYPKRAFVIIGRVVMVIGALALVLLAAGITVNTLQPGSLGELSELPMFTFDANWGSNRGATIKAGIDTWLAQDLKGKIFGVGSDCMSMYIHSGVNQELLTQVQATFGTSSRLTNAHCEWLTVLVNEGVFGAVAFAGMMVSAMISCLKNGKNNVIAGACGICLLAYTANNIFSFQQVMSTGTMYLILGIGAAFLRKGTQQMISTEEGEDEIEKFQEEYWDELWSEEWEEYHE